MIFIQKHTAYRVLKKKRFLNTHFFVSNARLKFVKTQANAKQHREAQLLLFENYSHSSSTLSSKNNRTYFEK